MKNFYNDKELLSAYLDRELSQIEKKYLEEKIKTSLELQKELSDIKKLKDLTSSSIEKISDSLFFETRVLASLDQNPSSKLKLSKWIPAAALLILTIGLMILLKFNPNLINHLIEEQKSNLAGFYKENLQPLLYAANLTNEDIFNFAVYQQLPLDSTNQQILKLGSDPQGAEYFEIKKIDNADKVQPVGNLKKFVTALGLGDLETRQIDSIIGSYSEQLSSLVLVNDQKAVAINPNIWNTRKAILADILSFAQKHASENLNKIVSVDVANFDVNSVAKWVNEAKNIKDDQYIFFTPDSIFKENFEFDMADFKKNMKLMEENLRNVSHKTKNVQNFTFYMDTTFNDRKRSSSLSHQFKVFTDSNFVKVTVQNFDIPDINIQDIEMPDFDSIAIIINEATKNVTSVRPPSPPMPFNNKSFKFEYKTGNPKKGKKIEFNLDSLMNLKKIDIDSLNNSINQNYYNFLNDSLMIFQNNALKKEMDNLRKELKRFRQQMKNYENKDDENNQNNLREIKNNGAEVIQI